MKKFYVFGIQRTCTNFAKAIIEQNFHCKYGNLNDYGHWSWKHSPDAERSTANLTEDSPLIFCYKTPYMWLESIIRKDVDFINRHGCAKFGDDIDPDLLITNKLYKWSIRKAIEVWTEFHINWMKYIHRSGFVIMNQKKMCHQPDAISTMVHIQSKGKLIKKMPHWNLIEENVDYKVAMTDNFKQRKMDYLADKTTYLTPKQKDYIDTKVPKEVIDFYENKN